MSSHVAVGMIHDEDMDARFVRCLTGLNAQRRPGEETLYVESGGGSLDRGRNLLVQKFLQTTDEPWFLMLDTDQFFGLEEYDHLLSTARKFGHKIVSGLYFANERPPRPAMYRWDDEGHATSVMEWKDGDCIEVDGAGAGFLLVHRDVYKKMDHPEEYHGRAGSWFNQDARGPADQLMNEDNSFCIRAQAHGYRIFVDTACSVGHMKRRVLGWE